jgi:phosphoglycerate dehydrogenase-like enzyme
MAGPSCISVAVGPDAPPDWVEPLVHGAGGRLASLRDADALIWLGVDGPELGRALDAGPHLRWVQLAHAGIEVFAPVIDDARVWTCAKGAFSETVAEHALALALALARDLKGAATATSWRREERRSLFGSEALVLGAGGSARVLTELLAPFGVRVTAIRRSSDPAPGASATLRPDDLLDALPAADLIFLMLPLTPETTGIIARRELQAMKDTAILVNVARGGHIATDDLVEALEQGWIQGAGLDVTDPEPLPDDHRLWQLPNCLITSHSANSQATYDRGLRRRVEENLRRWANGEQLVGVVDPSQGY